MSKTFTFLMILALIGLLCTCQSAAQPTEAGATGLPFTTLEQDIWPRTVRKAYEGHDPALTVVTARPQVIYAAWKASDALVGKLVRVDYNTSFVIVVFQGRKGTHGYGVEIEAVSRSGDTITVSARFTVPGPDYPKADEITSPYQAVRVSKTGGGWGREFTIELVVDETVVASETRFIP